MGNDLYRKEYTINMWKLFIISYILYSLLNGIVIDSFYNFTWGIRPSFSSSIYTIRGITIVLIGIFVHELIHGITSVIITKGKFSNIRIILSFKLLICAACYVKDIRTNVRQAKIIVLMPFLVTGIVPLIISFFINSPFLKNLSMLFCLFACGDLWMFNKLCKENNSYYCDGLEGKRKNIIGFTVNNK